MGLPEAQPCTRVSVLGEGERKVKGEGIDGEFWESIALVKIKLPCVLLFSFRPHD